ncbi:MAG: mevalonate kinase [Anaerolineales bacterium]|nr:mevalonate kinase [Anaerolineales bacterium]
MSIACAPGKIILFGEHAVVYGRPALAVPVTQLQATAEVQESPVAGIWVEAPDISLHSELTCLPAGHALRTVIESVFRTLNLPAPPPLRIRVTATIPVASGLGSGAAVSVAIIRALCSFLGQSLSDEQVNALAYNAEKLYHGTPSGIDNTVITYGRPVYFVRGQPIETFRTARAFTLLIGDTGIPAPTRESVGDVRKLWEADRRQWEAVFDAVGEIVRAARDAIESGHIPALGPLMNANHALLQAMTVSCPELDRLVLAARQAGALGAKLSGGGRGGNMIALVTPERAESVAAALRSAGAKNTIITTIQENP